MVRIIRVADLGCGLADVYDRQVDGAAWERETEEEPTMQELREIAAAVYIEPAPVYVDDDFEEFTDI